MVSFGQRDWIEDRRGSPLDSLNCFDAWLLPFTLTIAPPSNIWDEDKRMSGKEKVEFPIDKEADEDDKLDVDEGDELDVDEDDELDVDEGDDEVGNDEFETAWLHNSSKLTESFKKSTSLVLAVTMESSGKLKMVSLLDILGLFLAGLFWVAGEEVEDDGSISLFVIEDVEE